MFTPIKPPPAEDPTPPEAPVAAPPPAKAPPKGAAAKAPVAAAAAAAKGPAKGAAAAAVDQAPPLGALELGWALELLGAQVHNYYAWRDGATLYGLPAEPVTADNLAGYRSLLSGTPPVCI